MAEPWHNLVFDVKVLSRRMEKYITMKWTKFIFCHLSFSSGNQAVYHFKSEHQTPPCQTVWCWDTKKFTFHLLYFLAMAVVERLALYYSSPHKLPWSTREHSFKHAKRIFPNLLSSFGIFYWNSLEILNIQVCNINCVDHCFWKIILLPYEKLMMQ